MLISEEELLLRINSKENLAYGRDYKTIGKDYKITNYQRGRQGGEKSVPSDIKKVVALLAADSPETQKELGAAFGMNQSKVSQISRGVIGCQYTKDEDLTDTIKTIAEKREGMRSEAEEKALQSLLDSLDKVPEHLENASLSKVLSTAKVMSEVAEKMSTRKKNSDDEDKHVHLHLYAPNRKMVSDYEVVEAEVVKDK